MFHVKARWPQLLMNSRRHTLLPAQEEFWELHLSCCRNDPLPREPTPASRPGTGWEPVFSNEWEELWGGCLAKCISQRLSPLPCSKRGQRFLKTPRGSNYLFKNSFHTFRFRQCLTFSFSPLPVLPGSFCSLWHLFTVHCSACSKFHSLLIGALKCFF